ncbi:MAG: hypothetical protein KatS3mg060_1154 [Dehalococcoidia bacterium]|nr:MAG: hypothetical protein KatS3mg060_1154 [Dehalococcoidia bacterium]
MDPFADVPIFDHQQVRRPVTWLRARFGPHLTASWDRTKLRLNRIWVTEGPMTMTVRFVDVDGRPVVGRPITYGWPDGQLTFTTDERGQRDWVVGNDVWVDPTAPPDSPRARGPYWCESEGVRIEGIAWAAQTNHALPNFEFVVLPLNRTPIPPAPSGDQQAAIAQELETARLHLERALALLRER